MKMDNKSNQRSFAILISLFLILILYLSASIIPYLHLNSLFLYHILISALAGVIAITLTFNA